MHKSERDLSLGLKKIMAVHLLTKWWFLLVPFGVYFSYQLSVGEELLAGHSHKTHDNTHIREHPSMTAPSLILVSQSPRVVAWVAVKYLL